MTPNFAEYDAQFAFWSLPDKLDNLKSDDNNLPTN